MESTKNEYYRPREAQKVLKIGNTKFWNLVKSGLIPTVRPFGPNSRLVYVLRSDIDRFMRKSQAA